MQLNPTIRVQLKYCNIKPIPNDDPKVPFEKARDKTTTTLNKK